MIIDISLPKPSGVKLNKPTDSFETVILNYLRWQAGKYKSYKKFSPLDNSMIIPKGTNLRITLKNTCLSTYSFSFDGIKFYGYLYQWQPSPLRPAMPRGVILIDRIGTIEPPVVVDQVYVDDIVVPEGFEAMYYNL